MCCVCACVCVCVRVHLCVCVLGCISHCHFNLPREAVEFLMVEEGVSAVGEVTCWGAMNES